MPDGQAARNVGIPGASGAGGQIVAAGAASAARTRVGLVGINDRARRLLLPGLAAAPRAALVAVCSRDQEKARSTAAALGAHVRGFGSVAALLDAGVCDAVYVNTPVEAHVATCLAALDAGVAVICEKPLALTIEEAARLTLAAVRGGVRTAVNFTYRSMPGYRITEDWLHRQTIGAPRHARFELLQGHNFIPGFAPGSALLDSGCHLFDAMADLLAMAGFGTMEAVEAVPVADTVPDYGWSFAARTSSGVVASALFSRSALGWRNGLRWTLAGDARAIEVELDAGRTLARAAARDDGAPYGTWRVLEVPPDIAADDARFPAFHMNRLVGAIRGEEAFPGFAEAVATNRIADALRRSAARGGWVRLRAT